ncbi:SlyX family protein [Salinisphaera orenii]|uniref:SlyX protein n=1 Tax=Salinisphaera orenii YIM 95161 TaxID=1051139 RepID=A0A423Q432_9GAMM|nr:SlyX family protein [Salinisphaera halophila]ROO33647.1 SlyX protein [Salinisphaera halophila YIM 95161]
MSDDTQESLEIRLAYQEQAIERLGDVIYAQSREIEALQERCRELEARVTALADAGARPEGDDEPPPHY